VAYQLSASGSTNHVLFVVRMKTVRIFFDRIWGRICLERFRSVRIRVRIFNIRYCIRIQILKSYIYDIDIQLYLIRHNWHYPYSNPTRNIKTNMILMISVHIQCVFISTYLAWFWLVTPWCCLWPCLVPKKILQNFLDSPSYRIFKRMHGVLNIDENKN